MAPSSVMLDVTTFISAQEYIEAVRSESKSRDPFALQSFAEMVQSIFLYDEIFVPHPMKFMEAGIHDFGDNPRLLIELMRNGIVRPLNINKTAVSKVKKLEKELLDWLRLFGIDKLRSFLSDSEKDHKARSLQKRYFEGQTPKKLLEWSRFHKQCVRTKEDSHLSRIKTVIEKDSFGDYARNFAGLFQRFFENKTEKGLEDYLIATLIRGLRYQQRAKVGNIIYHPHALRRDFSIMCDCSLSGIDMEQEREVIKFIRGLIDSIKKASMRNSKARIQLLEFQVPLLGGKLWREKDIDKYKGKDWIEFVSGKIAQYREKASVLRDIDKNIIDEESRIRLQKDFDEVQQSLIKAFGFEKAALTQTEAELIEGGLALAGHSSGLPFPVMKGVLIKIGSLAHQHTFLGNPHQKFVFREFLKGWKRAGKSGHRSISVYDLVTKLFTGDYGSNVLTQLDVKINPIQY